jgi:hypothetical protein
MEFSSLPWGESMENMFYYSARQIMEALFSTIKGHLVLLAVVDANYLSMHVHIQG